MHDSDHEKHYNDREIKADTSQAERRQHATDRLQQRCHDAIDPSYDGKERLGRPRDPRKDDVDEEEDEEGVQEPADYC